MAALRWRVEHQHRYPSVETGFDYYWTTVYYYNNLNGDPAAGLNYSALLDATYNGSSYDNRLVAVRITNLETHTEYGIATPFDNHGTIPENGGGSLENVVRLSGKADGQEVSYHLWRQPLTLADIEAGRLSDDAWAVVNDVIIPALVTAELQNVGGVEVQEWTADRAIHLWQLRHGTKRRIGPVFAYP